MTKQQDKMSRTEALGNLFDRCEHFTPQEYHNEMVRLFPMYRNRSANIPSEEQIECWILRDYSYFDGIEGRTGIAEAEEKLGIKIGEDYSYPKGANSFEYNLALFYEGGLLEYTDYHVPVPKSLRKAYMCAWQNLHFHNFNEKDRFVKVRAQFEELCELNPQVRKMVFDKQDETLLMLACDGIMYGYPVEDVQFFVSEHARGNTKVGFMNRQKIKNESKKAGLPEWFNFQWVPSFETIRKMGERYQKAQKRGQVRREMKESTEFDKTQIIDNDKPAEMQEDEITYYVAADDELNSFMDNGKTSKNQVEKEPLKVIRQRWLREKLGR